MEMPPTIAFGKYLGVPTLHGRVTKATYQELVSKIDRKLAGWKAKCVSLAAIIAIPTYTMQTARVPRSICNEVDKKIRRFLWGGSAMDKKIHPVA